MVVSESQETRLTMRLHFARCDLAMLFFVLKKGFCSPPIEKISVNGQSARLHTFSGVAFWTFFSPQTDFRLPCFFEASISRTHEPLTWI